jgi:hypothetical protein
MKQLSSVAMHVVPHTLACALCCWFTCRSHSSWWLGSQPTVYNGIKGHAACICMIVVGAENTKLIKLLLSSCR